MEVITEKKYPIQSRWIWKYIIPSFISGIAIFIYTAISFVYPQVGGVIYGFLYLLFFLVYLIILILRKRNFHYTLDKDFMVVNQGVFSKQQRNVPYGVIQNLFVKQDLLDRLLGLSSLSIENASAGAGADQASSPKKQMDMVGFSGNKISIPGLLTRDAEALKSVVLQKMKEHPIDDSRSGL